MLGGTKPFGIQPPAARDTASLYIKKIVQNIQQKLFSLCKFHHLHLAIFDRGCYNKPVKQNSNLSRVAEGTGPVKPDNLRVSVRCQILRETER